MGYVKREKTTYELDINRTTGQVSYTDSYLFRTILELKMWLKTYNSLFGVTSCELKEQYNYYDSNYNLSNYNKDITELLDTTTDVYYQFMIKIGNDDTVVFRCVNFSDAKNYLRKYFSELGDGTKRYTITKYTRYFDKNDNYKIKTKSEILSYNDFN